MSLKIKRYDSAADLAAAHSAHTERYGIPCAATFDELDSFTWDPELLPAGYAWLTVYPETGEQHLFAPDGRNLSTLLGVVGHKADRDI